MKTHARALIAAAYLVETLGCFAQPDFTTQPANQSANQGFGASFSAVAASTSPPLKYQWFFQSRIVPFAITNVFTLTNVQPTDAGDYFVVASDATGSATSRLATLTVNLPVPLDTRLSPNIRVGEDPTELPTNRPPKPNRIWPEVTWIQISSSPLAWKAPETMRR